MQKIIIVGASGFGREVLWTLRDCNRVKKKYDIIGFVDDNTSLHGKTINDLLVLGGLDWFINNYKNGISCIVAIADNKIRKKIVRKLESKNVSFATIIHPSVMFSKFIEIGVGTVIQAGCILTTDIKIGNHVHINIDSTIGHDSQLNDFITINPGVHINGNTIIETGVYVGSGTSMKHRISIGKWSIIGAGTVLIGNVPEFSMYVGVPGKLKKKLQ